MNTLIIAAACAASFLSFDGMITVNDPSQRATAAVRFSLDPGAGECRISILHAGTFPDLSLLHADLVRFRPTSTGTLLMYPARGKEVELFPSDHGAQEQLKLIAGTTFYIKNCERGLGKETSESMPDGQHRIEVVFKRVCD